jgi:hypothetical protein
VVDAVQAGRGVVDYPGIYPIANNYVLANISGSTVLPYPVAIADLAAAMGAPTYQGTWNASTNSPALASSVGTNGQYYVVSVAGTTNLNGIADWSIGDWAIFNGTANAWQKIEGGATTITVGSTAITGGTTGRLLYDNAGTLGEFATTISGSDITIPGALTTTGAVNVGSGYAVSFASQGTITTNGTGVFLMRASGSVGGVINLATDSTFKFFARDGSTAAIMQGGTLALGGATIGTNYFSIGSNLLNVDSSGRLLIGTATTTGTSAEKFEVYNGTSLLDTSSTSTPVLYVRNRDTTTGGVFQPFITFSDNSGNRAGMSIDATNSEFNQFNQFGYNLYTGVANYTNLRFRISGTGATSIYTSLAVGGATIGSNALAVTGTATVSSHITSTNGNFINAAAGTYGWTGRSSIASPADGNIWLINNAGTSFGLLQFGGTTASFPALKRSTTNLQARLADDSDYTNVVGNAFVVNSRFEGLNATRLGPTSDGYLTITNQAVTSGIAFDVTTDATLKVRNRGNTADAAITAASLTTTGGGAFTITQANVVSPTSPNRTITISLGGTTYYLAAKTTND